MKASINPIRQRPDWATTDYPASHWHILPQRNRVMCDLCPRHCTLSSGQAGYCGVRRNVDDILYSENYGKSVAVAEEVIETEAIYHYQPGSRILSLGNIGCMMSCKFCQNWQTSQVRHLDPAVVNTYQPEEIIEIARDKNIEVISWTYNDPVVWHEFVMDTSRLANQAGIKTLYKSALYIEREPLFELIDVIDIFSISLKSMDPEFYRRIAHARIEPVLERISELHASNRHLEISQLVVTGLNDNADEIRKTVSWHLDNLDADVPLHFVGFHPAFQYLDVQRTPFDILVEARRIAMDMGVKNVYLGNVNQPGVSDSSCHHCQQLLVSRNGLATRITGLAEGGSCKHCGSASGIVVSSTRREGNTEKPETTGGQYQNEQRFAWPDEISSAHIELQGRSASVLQIVVEHHATKQNHAFKLGKNLGRALITKMTRGEQFVTIKWNGGQRLNILPVLDRAHFPV